MARKTVSDYDSPWKEALEYYFRPFLALCFPAIEADIDWSRGYEFMDKELQRIVRGSRRGRGHVDKLVKVWRVNGEETWVLIHIEVQHTAELGFPKRMCHYHSRLWDRYDKLVVSLAVLADGKRDWRPDCYWEAQWGCRSGLEFPIVKLLDFAGERERLEASDNPFAVVILAHLDTFDTRRRPAERSQRKLRLVKALYERGFSRQDVLELFRLIDWLMALPEALQGEFEREWETYEEGRKMPFMTVFERRGMEKGVENGRKEGQVEEARAMALLVLRERFTTVPPELEHRIGAADAAWCRALVSRVLKAETVSELLD